MSEKMTAQKCFVTVKMHLQLHKEHLSLQKSFSSLYRYMSDEKTSKNVTNWIQEKNRLESMVKHFKRKAYELQAKLEDVNERSELLEFCLLEFENHAACSKCAAHIDKSVSTEDLELEVWARNILNKCFNRSYALPNVTNSCDETASTQRKDILKLEMESENYRLQLKESQKKLIDLTDQLGSVLKYNCKLGVGMDYVIATVNELQSLMQWTSEKQEMKADSSVIFQKLQQIEKIQKDLENTKVESEQVRSRVQLEMSKPLLVENSSDTSVLEGSVFKIENLNEETVEEKLLIDLSTPEEGSPLLIPLSPSHKSNMEDSHDSLGLNISEDEGLGDESRRGDSTGPSSFVEVQDVPNFTAKQNSDMCSLITDITVTDPEGQNKSENLPNASKDRKNSLDVCLCAIGNLRESLKTKESELLKLSVLNNDQKQIAELQNIIVNFHKDTKLLKLELENFRKENASLKEQVLELEEAENDSRLQAQKLGEKLVFLQEKDSHFQSKLSTTRQALEKCLEELRLKEKDEIELKSQLKYMDTLVQKYEDQTKTMEIVELALRKKLIEEEDDRRATEQSLMAVKVSTVEKGTQMYDLPSNQTNLKKATSSGRNTPNNSFLFSIDSYEKVDRCIQVPENVPEIHLTESWVQTDNRLLRSLANEIYTPIINHGDKMSTVATLTLERGHEAKDQSIMIGTECPIQKELLKRLHQLVEEDAHLQQQLHYVDQINLTLWKKLHNLEFHIGECKKKNMSEDGASDSCFESDCEFLNSRPVSREQVRDESTATSKCASPSFSKNIIACLDQNEHDIKERLHKLEEINASFEKELELREKLYMEKEKKYGEWVQTEQRFIGDLKRLSEERDSLRSQVEQLLKDKKDLTARVQGLETEIDQAKDRHNLEVNKIKQEQNEMITQLQQKVDVLLSKEKDHLKHITNLKIDKNSDKNESDKLKSSYVELQLELSRTRDEMRKKEEEFRICLDELRNSHVMEEARIISELEMLRNQNTQYDLMITNFHSRQEELVNIVKQKEHDLQQAREEYKKNMQVTEEEHRAIEAELKQKLRRMEIGTAVTTQALAEERVRLEKELNENIDDLRSKEEKYKARISELECNVSHLHEELHRITGDIDSGFGSDVSSGGISSFRREKLMNQLRELRDREVELREKLDEMEQKEAAYRETLEHADRIVASVEQGYKNKIDELEISERNLKQRVGHLEEIESRLRGALHKERRSSDGRKPDDLVVELLEAEARENGLREKIEELESLQRNSSIKVKDLEKVRENLESQLSDKEEISSNLQRTQKDLETARRCLSKLKQSEADLKTSLEQTENLLATAESQMRNQIRIIGEEKKALEGTVDELRAQVRTLKKKLEQVSYETQRMSTEIPKLTVAQTGVLTTAGDPNEEPDYVDVDDCFPEPQLHPAMSFPLPRADPQRKCMPLSYSESKCTNQATSPREMRNKQSPIQKTSDNYDNARQNLENCMLRAMAAMKSDLQKKNSHEQAASNENDYDEILPRPTNLRVIQQVGSDTLLVGWNYVNPSLLEGFEVYVDGQLHETVYTPDRTKALISGLNLKRSLSLSICALSRYGQTSEPTVVDVTIPSSNGLYNQNRDGEENGGDDYDYESKRPCSMEW